MREPAVAPTATLSASLPPRSGDVAIRVCRGQINKEIAREMGIPDQTMKPSARSWHRDDVEPTPCCIERDGLAAAIILLAGII